MGSLLATVGFKLRGFFGLDGNSPWATGAGFDDQYVLSIPSLAKAQ